MQHLDQTHAMILYLFLFCLSISALLYFYIFPQLRKIFSLDTVVENSTYSPILRNSTNMIDGCMIRESSDHDYAQKFQKLRFVIFESQVQLLEHVRERTDRARNLYMFYQKFLNDLPSNLRQSAKQKYTFDVYLKFLSVRDLIAIREDDLENPEISITTLGKQFLNFLHNDHT